MENYHSAGSVVSTIQRNVLEEFIVPLTKEKNIHNYLSLETANADRKPLSITQEGRNLIDCRAIIPDNLLQKGYVVRHAKARENLSRLYFFNLIPDLSIIVKGSDTENGSRAFFIKNISDYTDYSLISQSIHEWFLQTLACFHTGGISRDDIAIFFCRNRITFQKKTADNTPRKLIHHPAVSSSVEEAFPQNGVGICSKGDPIAYQQKKEDIYKVLNDFATLPEDELKIKYNVTSESRDQKVIYAKNNILE